MKLKALLACGCLTVGWGGMACTGADWDRFRGPNGTGIAADSEPAPVEWSPTKNLKWKLELPGAGVSCPIVVGDRVFVTSYSGYGLSQESPGDMKDLVRHLSCVDKSTGKLLWQKDIPSTVQEDEYSGAGVPQHGYASHTPTSDGTNVYVFFGKSGVMAFDMEGKELWQTSVGTDSDPRAWGSSSSPVLHDSVIVVAAGPESRSLVGLDKTTGKELWRVEMEGLGMVWGTPALSPNKGETDLVIGVPNEIRAYDPASGELRWFAEVMQTDQFSSSVVVSDGLIYAIEGRGGGSVALKAGGTQDVTEQNTVWSGRDSGRFSSPLVYEGRLYNIAGGVMTCIDATDGTEIFRKRLSGEDAPAAAAAGPAGGGQRPGGGFGGPPGGQRPGGQGPGGQRRGGGGGGRGGFGGMDYSSPVMAAGKIYYVSRNGDMYVLDAGTEFKKIAVNRVTADQEDFSATPAISGGAIFVRSNKNLYCIDE